MGGAQGRREGIEPQCLAPQHLHLSPARIFPNQGKNPGDLAYSTMSPCFLRLGVGQKQTLKPGTGGHWGLSHVHPGCEQLPSSTLELGALGGG